MDLRSRRDPMTTEHLSHGPVTVVTAANCGVGLEVGRQLADRGRTAVAGCRDLDRGRRAATELDRSGERVLPRQLNMVDPACVRAAAG